MNQTDLGAAIEAAKGEATEVKTVKVDILIFLKQRLKNILLIVKK